MYFSTTERKDAGTNLISLTLPYMYFLLFSLEGRKTVEDNPWMDMSLSRVGKSSKSRRCKLTFRCTLQFLQLMRLEGVVQRGKVDTNKIMQY